MLYIQKHVSDHKKLSYLTKSLLTVAKLAKVLWGTKYIDKIKYFYEYYLEIFVVDKVETEIFGIANYIYYESG